MHLGVDLGGTKIEIIGLDSYSTEHYRKRIPSPQGCYEDTLHTLISLVKETESELRTEGTLGIGIPGALSPESGRIKNANSTWLIGHDLKKDLEQALQREIHIANDADCFTLSEAVDGSAEGANNVFGIILGTGVGGSLVFNGVPVSGPNAISGEWGHNPLPWITSSDRPQSCYCGKKGCIETFLSGPGMLNHYHLETGNHEVDSSKGIIELCRSGDHQATEYFSRYLNRLGKALASVINVVDPEIIVFGGGLSNIDEIYPLIREQVEAYIFSDSVNTVFVKAKHGDSSGVRGAAWLGAKKTQPWFE